ncbi:MAG: DUF3987 domain-containing protein [Rhodocyclaceae bacterium]|nr:DUF3987 domain-containing protein [Rhodocyclaceae bacterium]
MYSNEKSRAVLWDVVRFGALSIRSTEDGCWGLSKDYLEHAERIGATGNLPRMTGQLVEELSLSLRVPVPVVIPAVLAGISSGVHLQYVVQCPGHEPMTPALHGLSILKSAEGKSELIDALKQPYVKVMDALRRDQSDATRYEAKLAVWNEQVKAKKQEIRQNVKSPEKITALTDELDILFQSKPQSKQLATNLVVMNVTKEALQFGMFQEGPATTLAHDEASWFFKKFQNNFDPITQGYDGKAFTVRRRSSQSYSVDWQSLCLNLGIQTGRMDRLINTRGLELVESGQMPRMLIGMADESAQIRVGEKAISSDGRSWYFDGMYRLAEAYAMELKASTINRKTLMFDDQAQQQWIATRDWLIIAASERGLLWRIPEFALRCAQHIARVAANLHAHERYTGNLISLETLRQAILAVRDCADSYHMLFGRVHLEENQRDAIPILSFMVHCYNKPTQYQSQFVFDVQFLCRRTWGGQQVRKLDRLMAALTSLADAGILEWSSHMYNGHPVSVQLTRDFRTQFDAAHPKLFRPYWGP